MNRRELITNAVGCISALGIGASVYVIHALFIDGTGEFAVLSPLGLDAFGATLTAGISKDFKFKVDPIRRDLLWKEMTKDETDAMSGLLNHTEESLAILRILVQRKLWEAIEKDASEHKGSEFTFERTVFVNLGSAWLRTEPKFFVQLGEPGDPNNKIEWVTLKGLEYRITKRSPPQDEKTIVIDIAEKPKPHGVSSPPASAEDPWNPLSSH